MPTPRPQNQSGATRCFYQTPSKSKKRKILRMDRWKLRPTEPLYFTLEDLDLTFTRDEVQQVIWMWDHGVSFLDIAAALRPGENGQYEVFVLLLDLARKGKIKERPGWLFGNI